MVFKDTCLNVSLNVKAPILRKQDSDCHKIRILVTFGELRGAWGGLCIVEKVLGLDQGDSSISACFQVNIELFF